nr:lysozyme [Sphingobium yanoikuyae]
MGHTGPDVKPGLTITHERSQALLAADLLRFERAVNRLGGRMSQGQFDAMVSFAFNCGEGALKSSTLLKKHLAGDYAGAGKEFARWTRGGGKVLPGLVKRRAAEAALYMSC